MTFESLDYSRKKTDRQTKGEDKSQTSPAYPNNLYKLDDIVCVCDPKRAPYEAPFAFKSKQLAN